MYILYYKVVCQCYLKHIGTCNNSQISKQQIVVDTLRTDVYQILDDRTFFFTFKVKRDWNDSGECFRSTFYVLSSYSLLKRLQISRKTYPGARNFNSCFVTTPIKLMSFLISCIRQSKCFPQPYSNFLCLYGGYHLLTPLLCCGNNQ